MHMNIFSLILVWHFCWVSNTRWLENILKIKEGLRTVFNDKHIYEAVPWKNFPQLKQTNNNNSHKITGGLQDTRILMQKVKN